MPTMAKNGARAAVRLIAFLTCSMHIVNGQIPAYFTGFSWEAGVETVGALTGEHLGFCGTAEMQFLGQGHKVF